jgi:hypothetical protein
MNGRDFTGLPVTPDDAFTCQVHLGKGERLRLCLVHQRLRNAFTKAARAPCKRCLSVEVLWIFTGMDAVAAAHVANAAQFAQLLAQIFKPANQIPVMLAFDQLPTDCSDAYQTFFQVAVHAVIPISLPVAAATKGGEITAMPWSVFFKVTINFSHLGVATCIHKHADLQSARFSTGINCVYPACKPGLMANEPAFIRFDLQSNATDQN